jgi:hypothetical protein
LQVASAPLVKPGRSGLTVVRMIPVSSVKASVSLPNQHPSRA